MNGRDFFEKYGKDALIKACEKQFDGYTLKLGQKFQVNLDDDNIFVSSGIIENNTHIAYVDIYLELEKFDLDTPEPEHKFTVKSDGQDVSKGITRRWYIIDGTHPGTEVEFENETWAKCSDGTILDSEGYPWVEGNGVQYLAVTAAIEQFENEQVKAISNLSIGDYVTDGTDYAQVKIDPETSKKYYANVERDEIPEHTPSIFIVNDFDDDNLAD